MRIIAGIRDEKFFQVAHSHQNMLFDNKGLTETTINDPKNFAAGKDLSNLPYVQEIRRNISRFFTSLDARVCGPAFGAMTSTEIPPYQKPLRKALNRIDR